jgi:squalene-associated FAD-dependent desaturase
MRTAIVMGAGFAGLAAAVELADAGFRVVVLEKAPRLGGRASSFDERATGERCDNGQHVFIAGYRNARAFLEKIGAAGDLYLQDALSVLYLARGGRSFAFRATRRLPAPFHLLAGFLKNPLIGARDRVAMGRAASALLRMDEGALAATEPLRFEEWLRTHGQTRALIDAFWEVITLATINAPCAVVSAYPILKVLRLGFLGSADAGRLGYAAVPLGDLYVERAAAFVRARGGEVRLRSRVVKWEVERSTTHSSLVGVILESGERLTADVYVSALPFQAARGLAPDLVPAALRPAPIVDVHVWLDREILDAPFAALLGARAAQWVWNRKRMLRAGPEAGLGASLSVTISGAEEALSLPPREIEARVAADLAEFFPRMAGARVRRMVTIKEPHATLRLEPGAERLRPPARTPHANLLLAGDWTDTGLPSTIEGAVISGFRAVEAATGRKLVRPLEALEDAPVRLLRRLAPVRSPRSTAIPSPGPGENANTGRGDPVSPALSRRET